MNTRTVIHRICRIIAAAIIMQTLYYKFTAHPESVALFTKIWMEPYGRIGVGVAELIAGLLLLIPSKRYWFGAWMVMGLMAGALFFHATILGFEGKQGLLAASGAVALVCAGLCLIIVPTRKEVVG